MPALATVDDVAARISRPIPEEEKPRVQALIEDISAFVVDYCGTDFQHHDEDLVRLPCENTQWLGLPRRYWPGLVVHEVRLGEGLVLRDWRCTDHCLFRRQGWNGWNEQLGLFEGHVTVIASWGYTEVPAVVRSVVCAEVIQALAVSPGVQSEKVGDLEVSYFGACTGTGLSKYAQTALSSYRIRATSVTVRRV
ncbi:hypothetical protein [Streptomyces sp. 769]|uniref:hypothetical protein n=1 Tax=Streptomyces sp. 769 TaxID=1262452 RepID=UPI0005821609|nr:hypothetical protein [Streptomyces sp. 769]AJC53992.1 hypothetical protein GZL_01392 [Streptomyces sp. 769]